MIFVKITNYDLPVTLQVWYASHMYAGHQSPEQQVARLNKIAASQSLSSTYELATEAAYLAYRKKVDAELALYKELSS